MGNVGARRERDAKLVRVSRFLIVLRNALANLCRGHPHDRVGSSIVAWVAAEDLNTEGAFLELIASSVEFFLNDEAEESGKALAIGKVRILQQPIKLSRDVSSFFFTVDGL